MDFKRTLALFSLSQSSPLCANTIIFALEYHHVAIEYFHLRSLSSVWFFTIRNWFPFYFVIISFPFFLLHKIVRSRNPQIVGEAVLLQKRRVRLNVKKKGKKISTSMTKRTPTGRSISNQLRCRQFSNISQTNVLFFWCK